jgi:hypothetical protein
VGLYSVGDIVVRTVPLVTADRLDPARITHVKYRLKDSAKTRNWLASASGIDGEPYGIEADVFRRQELLVAFEEAMAERGAG